MESFSSNSWGSNALAMDAAVRQHQRDEYNRVLCMSNAEWQAKSCAYIRSTPPRERKAAVMWAEDIDRRRAQLARTRRYEVVQAPQPVAPREPRDDRLYRDMADEPWKYGDDVVQWADLKVNPTNRLVYWTERQAQAEIAEAKLRTLSATRIQALVRGYQARCKDPHQDCAHCLTHRISAVWFNGEWICSECMRDISDEVSNRIHQARANCVGCHCGHCDDDPTEMDMEEAYETYRLDKYLDERME